MKAKVKVLVKKLKELDELINEINIYASEKETDFWNDIEAMTGDLEAVILDLEDLIG